MRPNLRHAFHFSAMTRRTFTSACFFVCAPPCRTLAAVANGTVMIASETRRATKQRRMRWIHRHCFGLRDHSNEGHLAQEQQIGRSPIRGSGPSRRPERVPGASAGWRASRSARCFGLDAVQASSQEPPRTAPVAPSSGQYNMTGGQNIESGCASGAAMDASLA